MQIDRRILFSPYRLKRRDSTLAAAPQPGSGVLPTPQDASTSHRSAGQGLLSSETPTLSRRRMQEGKMQQGEGTDVVRQSEMTPLDNVFPDL